MNTQEASSRGDGIDRRTFIGAGLGGGALAAALVLSGKGQAQDAPPAHKLPPLPYATDALEPAIDQKTMEIHHGKHHQTYVTNLNKALADHPTLGAKPIDALLRGIATVAEPIRPAVRNHGGGHHNHTLFWTSLKPKGGGEPGGKLAEAIRGAFGGFSRFKELFSDSAAKLFGSGWAWLIARDGRLEIMTTSNQDSPLMQGYTPLLGLDLWEHAYYLKYQNRRPDYIAAWWSVVNWEEVQKRLQVS